MTKKAAAPSIRFKGFSDAWEQRKVGDFYDFKNGLNKGKAFFGKGTPIVNFTDVFHKRGITTQMLRGRVTLTPSEISNYGVKQGDIFVTRTSETIEEIGYASVMLDSPKDTVFSGFVLRGRAIKEDPLTLKFKQFVFSTDAFRSEMIKKSSMTTRALTSGTAIKKMYFQYPVSTEEQNRIGQFLESLDHLITLHQRKYEKLTNVKKSMLEKMFPQNGSSYPEIRFKGFTDPWEQRKFEDIAVRSSIISSESGLPRVEYEDIISGTGCLNKDIFNKESDKTGIVFHKGDVLYGKLRPYLQNWLLPLFDGLAVGDFWILQPQNADSSFLYRLIQSRKFDEVANQSTGTKMPRADWKLVSKTAFFIPSTIEEQTVIGTYFEKLDHLITLHQRELEKLQNIKKSMLEKMFV